VRGFWTTRSSTDKVKMKVAEAMANKVKAKATQNAQKRAEQVYRQTETVVQTLDSGMAKEIQSLSGKFSQGFLDFAWIVKRIIPLGCIWS